MALPVHVQIPHYVQCMHMILVNSKLFYTLHETIYWLHLNSLRPHKGICHKKVTHSIRSLCHKEKSNKIQKYIKILLFHIYMKVNMFRATHHPSSGA